jgi:CHAD domain-containing protein
MAKRLPPQKFVSPPLRAQARAGDAFIANAGAAISQIQANRAGAAAGRDPEHLHQLRVGIRRLRSTLLVFRSLLRRKEARRLDRRLRKGLRALGAARDWDVFEHGLGRSALRRHAHAQALKARKQASTAARSSAFRYLPGEALAWSRGRPWRESARAGSPIEAFAREALERAYAKLLKATADIDWNEASRRHRVRIRLKRLRYGCDCFAAAWQEEAMRPFAHRLRRLQGVLGDLNDLEVHRGLLDQLADAGAPARALSIAARGLANRERRLLASLRPSWRQFAALSPYWRVPEAAPVSA